MPSIDDDLIAVELDGAERRMLVAAMLEWNGPAHPTEPLVVAMGFDGLGTLSAEVVRLRSAIHHHEALTRQDWRRVLLASEIVFASDVVGSGVDWESTTEFSDAETIALLRSVQRKVLADTIDPDRHAWGEY